jgi:hypothetical protein
MAISATHMATVEDDARHYPGPESKPLWNESYWFTFVEPKSEIGFAARFGMLPNKGYGNFYLLVSQGDALVYSLIDQRAKLPQKDAPLSMCGYTIEVEKPLERFRLTFDRDSVTLDVVWEAMSPTCMWPHAPGSSVDQSPRHIEGSGRVKGTLRIGETVHEIDCFAHRDHSWGGERDWSKITRWDYLSGEIDENFWFNAVKLRLEGMPQDIHVGCLWDGEEVMWAPKIDMDVTTTEDGTRAISADVRMTDEKGREHHITGEMAIASGNVWFGGACLREGYARWRYGDRVGYGVHEHGYNEERLNTLHIQRHEAT